MPCVPFPITRLVQSVDRSEFAMPSERLNVFKLATDKLVYVTKISEEIVVVIANTSELNRRIELTPNRFVALFFRFTRNVDIIKSHGLHTSTKKSQHCTDIWLGTTRYFYCFLFNHRIFHCAICNARLHPDSDANLLQAVINKNI